MRVAIAWTWIRYPVHQPSTPGLVDERNLVHHLGTVVMTGRSSRPVDQLGRAGLLVPGHPDNLLRRHPTRRHDAHEALLLARTFSLKRSKRGASRSLNPCTNFCTLPRELLLQLLADVVEVDDTHGQLAMEHLAPALTRATTVTRAVSVPSDRKVCAERDRQHQVL
jgi:hypothetical protein